MLCKKCHQEITKEEAIYKKWAPIWRHDYDPWSRGWKFYSGYFCKKCAKQTDKNSKFLWIYFSFFVGFLLGITVTTFFIIKFP